MRTRRIKIYKVEVKEALNRGIWYYNKTGKWFDCVLVPKENPSGEIVCRFMVVDATEDSFFTPRHYLSIAPEDCRVIEERNVFIGAGQLSFMREFAKAEINLNTQKKLYENKHSR